MLSFSSPLASLSYRHISLGVTKGITPGLRLLSTSRVRSHRPKAFFGGNQGDSDQHLDDFLASSWGGEQPDWTESPYQPDVLDEVWYEVSTSGVVRKPLSAALFLVGAASFHKSLSTGCNNFFYAGGCFP